MDEEHIKLLAKQCHQVILMKKKGNNEKTHFWKIQERGYAAQLLARYLKFIITIYQMFNYHHLLYYIICLDYWVFQLLMMLCGKLNN